MPENAPAPIVVGVDGTQNAIRAARWAAALADRLDSALRIVHARAYPGHSLTEAVANVRVIEMAEQHRLAETVLLAAEDAVRADLPDLQIVTELSPETVDVALTEISRQARLIVVGCDHVTAGGAVLVGSMTLAVAASSSCPLVAWRGDADKPNDMPIVLGVNNDEDSHAAITTAFELADHLGVEITAVHAWSTRRAPGEVALPFMIDWNAVQDDEHRKLADVLQPWMDRYPAVKVTCVVEGNKPSLALMACANDSQLIVIGTRGRAALTAVVLGSTGLNLLHHSAIPVVICRPHDDPK